MVISRCPPGTQCGAQQCAAQSYTTINHLIPRVRWGLETNTEVQEAGTWCQLAVIIPSETYHMDGREQSPPSATRTTWNSWKTTES